MNHRVWWLFWAQNGIQSLIPNLQLVFHNRKIMLSEAMTEYWSRDVAFFFYLFLFFLHELINLCLELNQSISLLIRCNHSDNLLYLLKASRCVIYGASLHNTLLNATMHLDKKMSLFTLLTAWEVFLRVRDAPTGELRSRLSRFSSTHLNMTQDFPALFFLDMLHLQIQLHGERLTAAISVVGGMCWSQYSIWGTACDEICRRKNNKQIKSEMPSLHSRNSATFLFIYLSGRLFYPKWGGIWSKLQAVKGVYTKCYRTQFPTVLQKQVQDGYTVEGEERHK